MTRDTCGRTLPEPFAFYDLGSSCWRMSQGTLVSDSTGSSPAWPRWGMTLGGAAYELPTLAPPTSGSGSLSLLGTPSAADAMGGHLTRGGKRSHELLLKGQVKALLPTPVAQDDQKAPAAHVAKKVAAGAGAVITSLTVMARQYRETGEWSNKLLPTPTANDMTGGECATRQARQENGRTGGPSLRDIGHLLPTPVANEQNPGAGGELRAALTHGPTRRNETGIDTMGRPNRGRRLLPTPAAQDAKQNALNEREAQRNPHTMWGAMRHIRTGDSSSTPSADGNTSPASPHPDQLTIEDA